MLGAGLAFGPMARGPSHQLAPGHLPGNRHRTRRADPQGPDRVDHLSFARPFTEIRCRQCRGRRPHGRPAAGPRG